MAEGKFNHMGMADVLIHQLVFEGSNQEFKDAIAPVKHGNLGSWVLATGDIGVQPQPIHCSYYGYSFDLSFKG